VIFKLAFRNVKRNSRRSILTASAVAVTVMSLIFAHSYFKGITEGLYRNLIRTEVGHIRISDRNFLRRERMLPLDDLVSQSNAIEKICRQTKGVKLVTPRLRFHVMLSHNDENEIALATGLDVEREKNTMPLFNDIIAGNYLLPNSNNMILGNGLAEKLGVNVGDSLIIITRTVYYSQDAMVLRVAGIFHTGFQNIDDHNFYLPIESARLLLDAENMASEILVFISDLDQTKKITTEIKTKLAGFDNLAVIPWYENMYIRDLRPYMQKVMGSLFGIIMFIAALVIINTMLMAVLERTHEMGIMMAMGLKGRDLLTLFLLEAGLIAIIGGLVGAALGSGLAIYSEIHGLDFSQMAGKFDMPIPMFKDNTIYPNFTITGLLQGFIFGLITAIIAAFIPCFKAAKLVPTEAIRKI